MKRKITFLLAALLLMSGLTWAQQITWSAADQGYENGAVIESVDFNDFVAGEFFKGTNSNAPKYYTTGAAIRCYGGNYFTITSDYVLTEIVLGFATGEGSNAITTDVGTYEDGTWTGSANEVTFTIGGTSGHRRIASFTITYDEGGTPAPSISANNVEIAYDATEGAIEYTINNPADDGVLTAATEAEWLTIGTVGETVPFTCSVNDNGERVATVTLTYTYDTDQTVTKNATVTQATNPNVPGSEANPYTVAQARAAIDAGTGTQGVYATGIVSAIPTAYSSQYQNVTFNMVDEEGDEVFLQAYRCVGDEAANVAVGDVVVVSGNLTLYNNSIYEFAQGCQVVSLEHPVITVPTITVTPAAVNATYEGGEGTLTVTYENITEVVAEVYFCDANGDAAEYDWIVAEINADNNVDYIIEANEGEARTAYLKVYALDDNAEDVYSDLVTINQAEYVVPALDYAELPFEFNGGRNDIEGTDGLTAYDLGTDYNANSNPTTRLKFDGTGDWMLLHFNEVPGTLTFDIKGNSFSGGTFTVQASEDGVTYEDLTAYTELGNVETMTFDNLGENVRYIKWIYTEKSQGNVGLGNIHLYEVGGGPAPVASITVAPATVNATAEGGEGTLIVTYANITEVVAEVHFCDANGEAAEYDWIIADINAENNVEYLIEANEGEARTAYLKVYALDDNAEDVYSNLVTINQAEYVVPALDYAELPFEFDGGRADIEGTDGLTQEGLDSDYGSSPKLKFNTTGDWMLLHFNEVPGTLTFDIKGNGFSGGTFTVQTSEDGETYEDMAAYTELNSEVATMTFGNLDENVRYIKWIYTEKVSGNVALGNIHLYEFGGGPAPVASITVDPATVNATVEGGEGTLTVTYENITEVVAEVYFCDANGEAAEYDWIIADVNTENNVDYLIEENEGEARTAYLKVSALDDNTEIVYSNLVTINQEAYVAPVLDYATLPFEFSGNAAEVAGTDGLTENGLASYNSDLLLKFDGSGDWLLLHFNEEPGELAYDIKGNGFNGGTFTVQTSVDGETYDDLATYTEFGSSAEHEVFNNLAADVRYIKWIYTEKVSGNVALGNITLAQPTAPVPSITVAPAEVSVDSEEHDGTLDITYDNLTITDMDDFDIQYYDAEGNELGGEDEPAWIEVLVAQQDPTIGEGYVVSYYMIENEGEARTAYFKVYAMDANAELVYSNLVTISQAAYVAPFEGNTYTLATSIECGRRYIIVGMNGEDAYAMGNQNNNNRAAVPIVIEDGVAQVSSTDVFEFVINFDFQIVHDYGYAMGIDSYLTIYDPVNTGYLYAASSSSNWLRTREFKLDGNDIWSIYIGENHNAIITASGNNTHNLMRYNSSNNIFSCYTDGQQPVYLYVKNEEVPQYDFYKDITGYGESDGGYYLVTTPTVNEIDPVEAGMISSDNNYDLYSFDFTQAGEEWRNYKAQSFVLNNGQGYLYANKNNTTLHFHGTLNASDRIEVALQYSEGATYPFNGWNLIGNPFSSDAVINHDYYELYNNELSLASGRIVSPLKGIFVQAQTENEVVAFEKYVPQPSGWDDPWDKKIDIEVSGDNGSRDIARIRFGEGRTLNKFMLNENNTKVYIPQGAEDFAVVRSANEGEMPVNFKAKENGNYTISVNAADLNAAYLHLIDNMTGADIDLLQTPSYSFDANTGDNANRFRLVFSVNNGIEDSTVSSNASFAYFNGNEWVISNTGNATLQVVDMMGRVLSTETINGNATVNVNQVAGIYMLRLVNGNDVKIQKMVVK